MTTTTEAFIAQLTQAEQADLYAGLMKQERDNARSMAIQVGSLLQSYLAFLGRSQPVLANDALEVGAIIKRLEERS